MKKNWILAAVALVASFANAQEQVTTTVVTTEEITPLVYKPVAGEKTLEVQFAPLNAGTPITINGIRARKFVSATSALRLNAGLWYNTNSSIAGQATNSKGDNVDLDDKNSTFSIALAPGIEKHFAGTSRLSPYIGAELPFRWTGNSNKTENSISADDKVEWSSKSQNTFRIGLNAVAGADFYFTKKMYFGTELGFGAFYSKTGNSKMEISNPPTGTDATTTASDRSSSFSIAPNVQGQIRFGFVF